MQINNEFDMFEALLKKAEKKSVDKENRGEFFEGLNKLTSVLTFIKMKIEKGCVIFERGFDTVKVSIDKVEGDYVTLSYTKVDGFKEYKDRLTEAHEAAIRNFKLW